jgi:EAL domain-containing protein (putative c-di-GMP-specific phosphodiesterase class I)
MVDIVKKEDRLEVSLEPFSNVDKRIEDVDAIIEAAARERMHKVLVTMHEQETGASIDEMTRVAQRIHEQDWVLRRKGFHLVVAVVVVHPDAAKYAMREKVSSENKLPMRFFVDREDALKWLSSTDDLSDVVAYFQPIVRFSDREIVGYEALARKVVDGKVQVPAVWMDELFADPTGSLRLCRHMLVKVCDAFPLIDEKCYISINFEPDDLFEGALKGVREACEIDKYADRVVVEVAERGEIPLDAYKAAGLARTLGVRIALDDFGAGADRMSAIIDMKPSILKLDCNLIQRIHEKRIAALVKAFADFCKTEGISILAEGIENEALAGKCAELGIQLGQGDLYGKAAPL